MRRPLFLLVLTLFATQSLDAQAADVPAAAQKIRADMAHSCSGFAGDEGTAWRLAPADGDAERLGYTPDTVTLVRFPCQTFAYNTAQLWVLADEFGGAELLAFATPKVDITYQDDDAKVVKTMRLSGYTASILTPGSSFDPVTRTIAGTNLSRGMGDAYETMTWRYSERTFTLESFAVDPTFDGGRSATTVIENGAWVGLK